MKLSRGLEEALQLKFYNSFGDNYKYSQVHDIPNYRRYIRIDLTKDTIEFPHSLRYRVIDKLSKLRHTNTTVDSIIMPLYKVPYEDNNIYIKSYDKLFNYLGSVGNYQLTWYDLDSKKIQEKYLGTAGMLFTKHFETLLIWAGKFKVDTKNSTCVEVILYISPRVFKEENAELCKIVLGKMIPYYASKKVYVGGLNSHDGKYMQPKIVIGEPDFIISPNQLTDIDNYNETLNDILIEHIQDIIPDYDNS